MSEFGDIPDVGDVLDVLGQDWEVESVKFDQPDEDYFGPRIPRQPGEAFLRVTLVFRRG